MSFQCFARNQGLVWFDWQSYIGMYVYGYVCVSPLNMLLP